MSDKMLINYIHDVISNKRPATPKPKVVPKPKEDEYNKYLVSYHYENEIFKGLGDFYLSAKGGVNFEDLNKIKEEISDKLKEKLSLKIGFNIVILNIIKLSEL